MYISKLIDHCYVSVDYHYARLNLTCPLSERPQVQGTPLSSTTNENSSPAAIVVIFCPLKSPYTFLGCGCGRGQTGT